MISKKQIWRLSIVFGLIYFFSSNGMASLPAITISFLLKDTLQMTATQASYFAALSTIGWAIKPLWGIISDMFPIFGYRRKSYLIITSLLTTGIWVLLGQMETFQAGTLLALFIFSSLMYSFMDVIADALMVEYGKPNNLTARFQSVQWTSLYVAAAIASLIGGWVAVNLLPQQVFSINAIFPFLILITVIFFVKEDKSLSIPDQSRHTWRALKDGFGSKMIWILAAFLFFVTFSPSFGIPFFYYAVGTLGFDAGFFGLVGFVATISAAIGAALFGFIGKRIKTRPFIKLVLWVGVIATMFQLVYFIPAVLANDTLVKVIFLGSNAIFGAFTSLTLLVMLNAAAMAAPKYSEGTVFAFLTAFWNLGTMGSAALGGYLFGIIGLEPLIIVSAAFTLAAFGFLPFILFADEKKIPELDIIE